VFKPQHNEEGTGNNRLSECVTEITTDNSDLAACALPVFHMQIQLAFENVKG
jgi:hypothetical protein